MHHGLARDRSAARGLRRTLPIAPRAQHGRGHRSHRRRAAHRDWDLRDDRSNDASEADALRLKLRAERLIEREEEANGIDALVRARFWERTALEWEREIETEHGAVHLRDQDA